jgi:hypothetical protein
MAELLNYVIKYKENVTSAMRLSGELTEQL